MVDKFRSSGFKFGCTTSSVFPGGKTLLREKRRFVIKHLETIAEAAFTKLLRDTIF